MSEIIDFLPEPTNRIRYFTNRLKRIEAGEPVLLQRDFECDEGRVMDYFTNGQHVGFIVQDYRDMDAEAYKISKDPEARPELITPEPVNFHEALTILQRSFEK